MLDGSLAGGPVKVGAVICHAIETVIGDVVGVESSLPVEHVIDEVAGVLHDLLLRILQSVAT